MKGKVGEKYPLKVLHVPHCGLSYSGVPAVIFSIVENLHDQFQFDVISVRAKGGREKEFEQYGKLLYIPVYGKRNVLEHVFRFFIFFIFIFVYCKKYKYDIIHCHNQADAGVCLLAAKLAGVKTRISHSHNTRSTEYISVIKAFYLKIQKKLIGKYATHKIGCSEQACSDFFGEKADYLVIRNAVDFGKFFYSEVNDGSNRIYNFVHVGRYCYQKNQKFIIDIMEKVVKKYPNVKMKLVGYGEDENILKEIIVEKKLCNTVELVSGKNCDISQFYKEAGVMIFPSNFEGFGIVLIEAQAMGVYCFCSDAISKDADVGLMEYISLNESADVWSERICDYLSSQPSKNMAAVTKNLNRFSISAVMEDYERIYNQ